MLLDIAKNSSLLQNLVVKLVASIHPSIEHNIAKIEMLKKALFQCELERIEGGYFEFGIYEGTSLYAAATISLKLKSEIQRNLYGFDSFDSGFKYFDNQDKHPFFKEGDFKSSYEKALKRFKKYKNVKLIKGYFEETIQGKDPEEICDQDKCAIIFLDCDLKNATQVALDFISPILQKGTIIIVDDYWAYKGDVNLGTCGALNSFLKQHSNIAVRDFCSYGYGGHSFIVTKVN